MTDVKKELEEMADILDDTANGLEAVAVKLKMAIKKVLDSPKTTEQAPRKQQDRTALPFNHTKIQWQDRENEKGKFQVSEDFNSQDHKALLKFLDLAGGSIHSEGWFYWTYHNGSTVGRKLLTEIHKNKRKEVKGNG